MIPGEAPVEDAESGSSCRMFTAELLRLIISGSYSDFCRLVTISAGVILSLCSPNT